MNSIQSKQRIDFYINLTASARFTFAEYNLAMNDAINEYVDQQFGDDENADPKSFELNQQIRDNLFTLIKVATPTVTNGTAVTNQYYSALPSTFPYPADYQAFISLQTTVGGVSSYAKPTTYNEIGPLLQDSFKHPTNLHPYYVENSTGFTVWRETTGTLTVSLTYIKIPNTFSIGSETQLVTGVLANAATYYATEVSVYNGVTYQIGSTILGNGASLTSGQAILVSNTVQIDLPEKTHEKLNKMCAVKLLASIGMLEQAGAIQVEVEKS